MSIDRLIEMLNQASEGREVELEEIRNLNFVTGEDALDRAATVSWNRLYHFFDDADIRSRDSSYDSQMRGEMKWRAAELTSLLGDRG